MVIIFAITGFLLPLIYADHYGFPVPHVHDEFSYLLAADTFAEGRLSNPTPEFYEHYESPHILVTPVYMSKFPPVQAMFLAMGQIIFGQPIYGVWISCGLFAGSLFWMLSLWSGVRWAICGTFLMFLFIGIDSYWAQSFWGGTAAAFGGSIFFGAFRNLLNRICFGNIFLLITGGTILINSRPYEGFLTMLAPLCFLLIQIIKNKTSLSRKVKSFFLPAFLLTLISLSAMAFYNFKATGSITSFPYTVHQSQYFSTPLFVFESSSSSEPEIRGTERLKNLYNQISTGRLLYNLEGREIYDSKVEKSIYAVLYLLAEFPAFLSTVWLTLFIYIFLIPILKKNPLLILIAGTILITVAGMSLTNYWEKPHYSAPLTGCFYLLLIESLKYCVSFLLKKDAGTKYLLIFITAACTLTFFDWTEKFYYYYHPAKFTAIEVNKLVELEKRKEVSFEDYGRATYVKPEIEEYFNNSADKYLAIVSYQPDQSVHDEIVYNKADIENSKFIWANDLGKEKNCLLIKHFQERKILQFIVSPSQIKITPLDPTFCF